MLLLNQKKSVCTVHNSICLLQHLNKATVYNADSELSIHTQDTVFFMAAALHQIEIF